MIRSRRGHGRRKLRHPPAKSAVRTWPGAASCLYTAVRPRKGSPAVCSRCHQPGPGYDQLAERRFEFIPFWGFLVFLLYSMRRVDCRRCQAVIGEEVRGATASVP